MRRLGFSGLQEICRALSVIATPASNDGEGLVIYNIDAPTVWPAGASCRLDGLGSIIWPVDIAETRWAPQGQDCGHPPSATLPGVRFGIDARLGDSIAQMAW